jgi:hypothetical protein
MWWRLTPAGKLGDLGATATGPAELLLIFANAAFLMPNLASSS